MRIEELEDQWAYDENIQALRRGDMSAPDIVGQDAASRPIDEFLIVIRRQQPRIVSQLMLGPTVETEFERNRLSGQRRSSEDKRIRPRPRSVERVALRDPRHVARRFVGEITRMARAAHVDSSDARWSGNVLEESDRVLLDSLKWLLAMEGQPRRERVSLRRHLEDPDQQSLGWVLAAGPVLGPMLGGGLHLQRSRQDQSWIEESVPLVAQSLQTPRARVDEAWASQLIRQGAEKIVELGGSEDQAEPGLF